MWQVILHWKKKVHHQLPFGIMKGWCQRLSHVICKFMSNGLNNTKASVILDLEALSYNVITQCVYKGYTKEMLCHKISHYDRKLNGHFGDSSVEQICKMDYTRSHIITHVHPQWSIMLVYYYIPTPSHQTVVYHSGLLLHTSPSHQTVVYHAGLLLHTSPSHQTVVYHAGLLLHTSPITPNSGPSRWSIITYQPITPNSGLSRWSIITYQPHHTKQWSIRLVYYYIPTPSHQTVVYQAGLLLHTSPSHQTVVYHAGLLLYTNPITPNSGLSRWSVIIYQPHHTKKEHLLHKMYQSLDKEYSVLRLLLKDSGIYIYIYMYRFI